MKTRCKKISTNYKGVIDSTLREGMQFFGADFDAKMQMMILEMLSVVGVDYVEVGNPVAKQLAKSIEQLVKVGGRPSILAHIRNKISDLDAAIDIGVEGVNILCTVDGDRLNSMGKTLENHLEELELLVLKAQKAGLEVRVGVEDYFRGDKSTAMKVFSFADELRVNRVSIPDTVGYALPFEMEQEIANVSRRVDADIQVHIHEINSTANALMAIRGGANYIDTTVMGIGERTGITPLSALLVQLYMVDQSLVRKYSMKALTMVEQAVAKMVKKEVPHNLMTAGAAFLHRSGIHLNAVVKNGPEKYELISPSLIGNRRRFDVDSAVSGKTKLKDVERVGESI